MDFGVRERAVSVIPFGINNSVPHTDLTPREVKQRLGIGSDERTILFFGAIRPYKGLEYLVAAFRQLPATHPEYRPIIAGGLKRDPSSTWTRSKGRSSQVNRVQVMQEIRYIPDEETELHFKAADVLALRYAHVSEWSAFLSIEFWPARSRSRCGLCQRRNNRGPDRVSVQVT